MAPYRTTINTIWLEVDDARWEKNFKNYSARLKNQITGAGGETLMNEIVAIVAENAPTPIEEETLLMFGEEGIGSAEQQKYTKKGKLRSFFVAGRIRFKREPGMWIKEAITFYSVNSVIEGKGYQIGNVKELDLLTRFSWVDAAKGGKGRAAREYEHESTYGTFLLFEYGSRTIGRGTITPLYGKALIPTDTSRMLVMNKTITPFFMYSKITKEQIRLLTRAHIDEIRNEQ